MSFERDTTELEGALLPEAERIYEGEADATLTTAEVSLPEATALPGVFRDDKLSEGILMGRIKTQDEIDRVRRENLRASAIDHMTRREIEEANRYARQRNREEESGALQTSLNETRGSLPPKQAQSKIEENQAKTNGYQFGSYNIGAGYDTKPYDVNEYKSVYER